MSTHTDGPVERRKRPVSVAYLIRRSFCQSSAQAGDADAGLVAVVEEDEVLMTASHFVTRVGMRAADARGVDLQDPSRYGSSVQVGEDLCPPPRSLSLLATIP